MIELPFWLGFVAGVAFTFGTTAAFGWLFIVAAESDWEPRR